MLVTTADIESTESDNNVTMTLVHVITNRYIHSQSQVKLVTIARTPGTSRTTYVGLLYIAQDKQSAVLLHINHVIRTII